jgi:hypothetical protein
MSSKKIIWLGFFIGSTVGGMVPSIWGDDMISVAAFVGSLIGGIAGIWAGYRITQSL